MPNTGRPSKACTTCKRRKVKCSETRPTCRACARLGLSCEWKDVSVFRRQEDWVERLVLRRVKQVQILRGDSAASALAPVRPFPNQVTFDMESCALQRFYLDYAYSSGTCPFLYLVAPLYEQLSTPQCLHSAVLATSLATMARQLRRYEIMEKAHQYYGKALRKLAVGLDHSEVAKHDGTLLAVSLLGLCETIIHDGTKIQSESNRIHSQGRLAVLRLRGPEQLQTKVGRNLFTLLYHQQLIGSFIEGGTVMDEYLVWMNDWYPATPVARLETLMHEVSSLVLETRRALKERRKGTLHKLLGRCKEMEEILANVIQELPASWPLPDEIVERMIGGDRPADIPQPLFEKDIGLSEYQIITRALVANIFRAVRIHLLQTVNSIVERVLELNFDMEADLTGLVKRSDRVMAQIYANICNDAPLAIADNGQGHRNRPPVYGRALRAWSQLFPLQSALGVTSLSIPERERVGCMLEYTKGIVGMNMNVEGGVC